MLIIWFGNGFFSMRMYIACNSVSEEEKEYLSMKEFNKVPNEFKTIVLNIYDANIKLKEKMRYNKYLIFLLVSFERIGCNCLMIENTVLFECHYFVEDSFPLSLNSCAQSALQNRSKILSNSPINLLICNVK